MPVPKAGTRDWDKFRLDAHLPREDVIKVGLGLAAAAFWLISARPFATLFVFGLFAARPLLRAYWNAVKENDAR
ncbi:MAG: hypothetical protein JO276_04980 [Sphingomonadaceae bacterium]|nr:hypothetical protein [Sphingomonadaceae bacterium]